MAGSADWSYADEERTHEVRVLIRGQAPERQMHVVESAFGDRDPDSMVRSTHRLDAEWDARYHTAELEARLGMLAQYWKNEGSGWTQVPRRRSIVDLTPLSLDVASRKANVHHFHHASGGERMVLALASARPDRAVLAELDLEQLVPKSARLVHARLPPGPLQSLLAVAHLQANQAGYLKVTSPSEFAFLYGPHWKGQIAGAITEGVRRLSARERAAATQATAESSSPVVSMAVLSDPRLRKVHEQFMREDEEQALIDSGEAAIHRAIAWKRKDTPHGEQHLLSLLESSLLIREQLKRGGRVDADLVAMLDRLAYHLGASASQP